MKDCNKCKFAKDILHLYDCHELIGILYPYGEYIETNLSSSNIHLHSKINLKDFYKKNIKDKKQNCNSCANNEFGLDNAKNMYPSQNNFIQEDFTIKDDFQQHLRMNAYAVYPNLKYNTSSKDTDTFVKDKNKPLKEEIFPKNTTFEYNNFSNKNYPDKNYPDKNYLDKDYSNKNYSNNNYLNKNYLDKNYPDKDYSNKNFPDKDYSNKNYRDKDYSNNNYSDNNYFDIDYSDNNYLDIDYSDKDYLYNNKNSNNNIPIYNTCMKLNKINSNEITYKKKTIIPLKKNAKYN
jgi:hypothetical protein